MRILLDECLPRKLRQFIQGHLVFVLEDVGWKGKRNGELLGLATGQFDAILTVDKRFSEPGPHQPALIILRAEGNDFESLQPLLPLLLEALPNARNGQIMMIEHSMKN